MRRSNDKLALVLLAALLSVPLSLAAATVSYQYDSLNRLTQVTYPEGTVIQYSYDPAGNRTQQVITNSAIDSDGDGLTNQEEHDIYGTDPLVADTDGDGLGDGAEVGVPGYDADPSTTTDPLNPDSDGDGYLDGNNGIDPCEDCDNSGSITGDETDPSSADVFIRLVQGWNLFSYPDEVPYEYSSCTLLADLFGGFGDIESIARLNPTTGLFEQCDGTGGVDFPVEAGEAYVVKSSGDFNEVWPWVPGCPSRPLELGLNLVGHPSPTNLSCYSWLEAQEPGAVSSIQGYDPSTGRFETCALIDPNGNGAQPVGVDFPIRAAQGYLFHAEALGSVVYPGCP